MAGASLVEHLGGMFDLKEASSEEGAWEALLSDHEIRLLIVDLAISNADGDELVARMRSSDIERVRELPIVVLSDEKADGDRERAFGATELVSKGRDVAQLLSRLDALLKGGAVQQECERNVNASRGVVSPLGVIPAAESLQTHAAPLLAKAVRADRNFVLLNVCIGLKHAAVDGSTVLPSPDVVASVGELLRRSVRQSDHVAKTGEANFTVATCSINFDSAHRFAHRVCRSIVNAHPLKNSRMSFVATCGLVSLTDDDVHPETITLDAMHKLARRRALLGLAHAVTGVVGQDEEAAFACGDRHGLALGALNDADEVAGGRGGENIVAFEAAKLLRRFAEDR